MPAPVDFTGERFLPECTGEIWVEHWHRYLFGATFVAGKDVLDAACGEGYGSAWLARHAKSVTGLDLDAPTVEHARTRYRAPNLRFETGSVAGMPFPDASFDCAVSFETLEHLTEQEEMLAEFRRVLRPDGILIISTPNRVEYSERRRFHNEFHVKELDESEFHALIARHFPAQRWFGQKLLFNSAVWPLPEAPGARPEWVSVDDAPARMPTAMYFVAIAAASARFLPGAAPVTLLGDPDEAMYREYEQTVARVETLERLARQREAIVAERDLTLATREGHIRHLDELAIQRERIVEERDRQLDAQSARITAMETLIASREATILDKDRLLADTNDRATALERLIGERESIVVERDAALAAVNARMADAERLITDRERIVAERDAQLAAINARIAVAERLIAERESVIAERDRQLAANNERASVLERLVAEREQLIVERDRQLGAVNERAGMLEQHLIERERIIVERDDRAQEMERTIAARDQQLLDQQGRLAQASNTIVALEADKQALQREIVRRSGWRWWVSLPYRRIRRALDPAAPLPRQGES